MLKSQPKRGVFGASLNGIEQNDIITKESTNKQKNNTENLPKSPCGFSNKILT